jgi:hypothetical protein
MYRNKKQYIPRDLSLLYEYVAQENFDEFQDYYFYTQNNTNNQSFLWKTVCEDICHMVSYYKQKKDDYSISNLLKFHEQINIVTPEKMLSLFYFLDLEPNFDSLLRKGVYLTRSSLYHFYDNLKHTKTLIKKNENENDFFIYYQSKVKKVNHLDSLLIKNEHNLEKKTISKI